MTLVKDSVVDLLRKQQFNCRSSAKSEIMGVDKCIKKMEWTKNFLHS